MLTVYHVCARLIILRLSVFARLVLAAMLFVSCVQCRRRSLRSLFAFLVPFMFMFTVQNPSLDFYFSFLVRCLSCSCCYFIFYSVCISLAILKFFSFGDGVLCFGCYRHLISWSYASSSSFACLFPCSAFARALLLVVRIMVMCGSAVVCLTYPLLLFVFEVGSVSRNQKIVSKPFAIVFL